MHNYSEVRKCLDTFRAHTAEMQRRAGRVNLPGRMSAGQIKRQLDAIEREMRDAEQALEAARSEATQAGRRGLAVVE